MLFLAHFYPPCYASLNQTTIVQGTIVAALVAVMVGRANNGSATTLLLCFCNEQCLKFIFVFSVFLLCFNTIHVRVERYSPSISSLCICVYVTEREVEHITWGIVRSYIFLTR